MKPYQLVKALMHRDGLGPLPLAKKMGKPKLQSQIHRFVSGEVLEPARTTAAPVAAFFKIEIEAMYDEKVATETAKTLGLREVPAKPAEPKQPRRTVDQSAAPKLTAQERLTLQHLREVRKLNPQSYENITNNIAAISQSLLEAHRQLNTIHGVKTYITPKRAAQAIKPAPGERSQPESPIGGNSGFSELDESHSHRGKR